MAHESLPKIIGARITLLGTLPVIPVAVAAAVLPASRSTMGADLVAVWTVAVVVAPVAAAGLAWGARQPVTGRRRRVGTGALLGATGFAFGPLVGAMAVAVWTDFVEDWLLSTADAVPVLLLIGAVLGAVLALPPPASTNGA